MKFSTGVELRKFAVVFFDVANAFLDVHVAGEVEVVVKHVIFGLVGVFVSFDEDLVFTVLFGLLLTRLIIYPRIFLLFQAFFMSTQMWWISGGIHAT